METMVARAFLAYLLKQAGRENILDTIRQYEKSLEDGRYLQDFEICSYLRWIGETNPKNKVEIHNPTEDQAERVFQLWQQYERERIWPQENVGVENDRSKLEQIHEWEDWACERMGLKSHVF